MKKNVLAMVMVLAITVGPASAWSHGGRWGGSTSHSWGSTSHSNAWGGSSSHTYGEGSSHSSAYGTSTSHAYGGGTSHTNVYGGTTTGAYGAGAVHTTPYGTSSYASAYHPPGAVPYYGYHPPTTVAYYGGGCYYCASGGSVAGAAIAGAAVGMAIGAASANAAAANTSSAYNAGYVAGATNSTVVQTIPAPSLYIMGAVYAAVPPGCVIPQVNGKTYYLCGSTWFSPFFGANGANYRVVPTP